MLRLANADVLPLRTEDFANAVTHYVDEIEATAQAMRHATEEEALLQQMHVYELARSHNDPAAPPARDAEVPYINFAPLRNSASC
jgi:N-acetylated-alpha-linked acidic dipeptidase